MYDPLLCTCGRGCLRIICPARLLATMHLQREGGLRAQCVLRTQTLRAINNGVRLEPCTSWGAALADGTAPPQMGGVSLYQKTRLPF